MSIAYYAQNINSPIIVVAVSNIEDVLFVNESNPYRTVFALGYCIANDTFVPVLLSRGNGAGDDIVLCEGYEYDNKVDAVNWLYDVAKNHKHEEEIKELADWINDSIDST